MDHFGHRHDRIVAITVVEVFYFAFKEILFSLLR